MSNPFDRETLENTKFNVEVLFKKIILFLF